MPYSLFDVLREQARRYESYEPEEPGTLRPAHEVADEYYQKVLRPQYEAGTLRPPGVPEHPEYTKNLPYAQQFTRYLLDQPQIGGPIGAGEAALNALSGMASYGTTMAQLYGPYLAQTLADVTGVTDIVGGPITPEPTTPFLQARQEAQTAAAETTYEPRTRYGQTISAALTAPAWAAGKAGDAIKAAAEYAGLDEETSTVLRDATEFAGSIVFGKYAAKAAGGIINRALRAKSNALVKMTATEPVDSPRLLEASKDYIDAVWEDGVAEDLLKDRQQRISPPPTITPPPGTGEGTAVSPYIMPESPRTQAQALTDVLRARIGQVEERMTLPEGADPTMLPRIRAEGQDIVRRLNENPDNAQNISDAVAYMNRVETIPDVPTQQIISAIQPLLPSEAGLPRAVPPPAPVISTPEETVTPPSIPPVTEATPAAPEAVAPSGVEALPPEEPTPAAPVRDDLHAQASQLVQEKQNSSINFLQRRLKIGYDRASRIMAHLEEDGVVSPKDSQGRRTVLTTPDAPSTTPPITEAVTVPQEKTIEAAPTEQVPPVSPPGAVEPTAPVGAARYETAPTIGIQARLPAVAREAEAAVRPPPGRADIHAGQPKFYPLKSMDELNYTLENPPREMAGLIQPTSAPIQVRHLEGRPDAIIVDPTGMNIKTSANEIQRSIDSGRMSQEMGDSMLAQLRKQAEIASVPIDDAHNYTGMDLIHRASQMAKANDLELYRAVKEGGKTVYRQVADVNLDNRIRERDMITPGQKAFTRETAGQYVAEMRKPVGKEVIDKIQQSIVDGTDISGELPPEVVPHYNKLMTLARDPISQSAPMDFMDVFADVNTILGEKGQIGRYGLDANQKAAVQRLQAQATRLGKSFKTILRNARGLNPAEKILYERYVDSLNNPPPPSAVGPRNMQITPQNAGMRVVKQDTAANGLAKPPVFADENVMMQTAQQISKAKTLGLEPPGWWFKRAEIEPILDAYRLAERNSRRALDETQKDLTAIKRGFSNRELVEIGAWNYERTPQGQAINKYNKVTPPSALTPKQQTLQNAMRRFYDEMFRQINASRVASGIEPIPYIQDYMTFARAFSIADHLDSRIDLMRDPVPDIISKLNNSYKATFPQAKPRTGGVYPAEYNVSNLMEAYARGATRQVHMQPFLAKMHEMIDTELPDINNPGQTFRLEFENPGLWKSLRDWTDFISTGASHSLPDNMNYGMRVLSRNLNYAYLAYSFKSALNNFGSLTNTADAFGFHNLLAEIAKQAADIPSGARQERAYKLSNVLDTRHMAKVENDLISSLMASIEGDVSRLGDVARVITSGRIFPQGQEAIGDLGMKGLNWVDAKSTEMSWNIAFDAFKKKNPGISDVDAARMADSATVLTQGGTMPGDLAAISRTQLGSALAKFSNYALADWSYLTNAVFGKERIGTADAPRFNPLRMAGIMKFALINAAFNLFYNYVFHTGSPNPDPEMDLIRGLDENQEPLEIAKEMSKTVLGKVPFVKGMRYSNAWGGPIGSTLQQAYESIYGERGSYPLTKPSDDPVQAAARLAGSPLGHIAGIPGASTVRRTVRGTDVGQPFFESMIGVQDEERLRQYRRRFRR